LETPTQSRFLKPHLESQANGFDLPATTTIALNPTKSDSSWEDTELETPTQSKFFKPHLESQANGFDLPVTTTMVRNGDDASTTKPPQPDIGSIIQSFLTTAMPMAPLPSVHVEKSEDGWQEASQDMSIRTSDQHQPIIEVTVDGFALVTTAAIPQVTSPIARATPQFLDPQGIPLAQVTPPPIITHDGITLRPVPVTRVRVTTVDGKPTTVEALVNYRYVVGSATLQIGTPTTINNVVVALSVNPAGSTILVAGDQTTTLPPPARWNQAGQATGSSQAVKISTTVIDGTTKYVLAGQTLAPGQAVTVGDIPISIGTQDGSTVLVMGDITTTFAGGPKTMTIDWGTSAAATPGSFTGNGNIKPASTSAKAGAPSSRATNQLLTGLLGLVALTQAFI
jgi:hypothetical protein